MTTEAWFRNPNLYIRELVECGEYKIAWDRGLLVKRRIDADKHAALYFGRAYPWRALLVGSQGTAELGPDNPITKPKAVYPTWVYGEPIELLEDMISNPAGKSQEACQDMTVSVDERPVWGQEHRVVITEVPSGGTGPGRKFLALCKTLQEDHPECIIHIHSLYSYRLAFGLGFGAADVEPRTAAAKGKVHLPSGVEESYEKVQAHPQWAAALGFKPVDLIVPRNRCMYNIKAAVWAGENYEKLFKFKTRGAYDPVDSTSSDKDFKPVTTLSMFTGSKKAISGDKFACDSCSLSDDCKYFRAGAVCSVPGAEPTELARYFKTRDAATIIDGLGTLLAANSRRLQRGMEEEDTFGDMNPEVTKVLGQVFEQGVKLAKLVDPNLRGGPKIQVNVGANGQVMTAMNPRQQVAEAMRELEVQGFSRDQITPELIQSFMSGNNPRVISGTVVENGS